MECVGWILHVCARRWRPGGRCEGRVTRAGRILLRRIGVLWVGLPAGSKGSALGKSAAPSIPEGRKYYDDGEDDYRTNAGWSVNAAAIMHKIGRTACNRDPNARSPGDSIIAGVYAIAAHHCVVSRCRTAGMPNALTGSSSCLRAQGAQRQPRRAEREMCTTSAGGRTWRYER